MAPLNSVHKDDRIFHCGDVVKVDIGVHVNGRIIDSAFTHIVTDKAGIHDDQHIYNDVLEASRESMLYAIKLSGPEQSLYDMSEGISEIINSYAVSMDNELLPIKPVIGIGGHNIKQYDIHAGKYVLSSPDLETQKDSRMEEDEIYAIETFATTGKGFFTQNHEQLNNCTHFMEDKKNVSSKKDIKMFKKTELYNWLPTRHGLPFSISWINDKVPLNKLSKSLALSIPSGQLAVYPPLYCEDGCVVAQFEHTIHVKNDGVEIFSLGVDY